MAMHPWVILSSMSGSYYSLFQAHLSPLENQAVPGGSFIHDRHVKNEDKTTTTVQLEQLLKG